MPVVWAMDSPWLFLLHRYQSARQPTNQPSNTHIIKRFLKRETAPSISHFSNGEIQCVNILRFFFAAFVLGA